MKAIGLDLGNRTLGIALSDEMGFLARPLETFRFPDKEFDLPLKHVLSLVQQEGVHVIEIGRAHV